MGEKNKRIKFLETRNFGLVIGLIVLFIFFLLFQFTKIPINLKTKMLDAFFVLKTSEIGRISNIQVGVVTDSGNQKVSDDILIVGIDATSLNKFGRWPFPRYRHANLLDSMTRIKNQEERERAVFLDIMLNEPESNATNDAILLKSMEESGRVFLETTLDVYSMGSEVNTEYQKRFEALSARFGEVRNVQGPWMDIESYSVMETPLVPYVNAVHGYGHADFKQDYDGVYRYLPVIARLSQFQNEIRLDDLKPGMDSEPGAYEYLMWTDRKNIPQYVPFPLTEKNIRTLAEKMKREAPQKVIDSDGDGKPDESYFVLGRYSDRFIPSISLMLSLEYFHRTFDDLEIVLGKYIRIKEPLQFDVEKSEWVPYEKIDKPAVYDEDNNLVTPAKTHRLSELRIPIDSSGRMLINYMGPGSSESHEGHQTYRIRPYYGYASSIPSLDPESWPRSKALGNKLVLVGTFAKGLASDEKTTPYGLMYGVEMHANALNTIIMDNFLRPLPVWSDVLILILLVMLVAFMTSRMSTIVSMIVVFLSIFVFFITCTIVFDFLNIIIDFPIPAIAMIFTFLSIVVYRVMTEEKDKKRIRDMFGKYVSPTVVDQILSSPPELGGVDKEISVFFSDIRGFTTLSENMSPQELVNHLNVYLTAMTDIIMEYQGTLDKYVGDEIMCFWGAPLPQPDHALLACKCALKQMAVLKQLNDSWPEAKRINIGIGLNSGIMTVGNMGSKGRMNYTLTGDNVNLGARLEGTNKEYRTNIIISEYTYGLVKDKIIARELDNIRVKGKNKPVFIYELVDVIEGLDPPSVQADGKKHHLRTEGEVKRAGGSVKDKKFVGV